MQQSTAHHFITPIISHLIFIDIYGSNIILRLIGLILVIPLRNLIELLLVSYDDMNIVAVSRWQRLVADGDDRNDDGDGSSK